MKSRLRSKLLISCMAAVAAAAVAAPVAAADTPAPGYAQFAGCPSASENPSVAFCIRSTITGGHFQMGSKTVPIEKPITLSGGVAENGDISANSKGGLTAAKQKVPGGVVGLTGLTWLLEFLGSDALTLYAVTELAGQPVLSEESLAMPLKVHLVNPVLGNNCYVGSAATPIMLHLTNGTTDPPPPNEPISGTYPELSGDELGILHADNGEFVDNSFAAPGASGCTLTLFGFIPVSINSLVNLQAGLPSAAGRNETRQEYDSEVTERSVVYP